MNTEIFSQINWLAVLVASLAYFLVGAVWYSALFRNAWIKSSGVNTADPNMKKGVAGIFLTSFIFMLVACIGLALLLGKIETAGGWMTGLKVGLIAGICFCATAISNSYLYEKRPTTLHIINDLYNIVGCSVAGIIIAIWPK
jgi:small-conductance mechanosensitive channel